MFTRILPVLLLSVPAAGQSLVAHYKLDETSGTVVADSSGNGLDGTTVGTTNWVPGHIDGALDIVRGGYVTTPSSPLHDVTHLTIATWVNLTNYGDWDGILTKGTSVSPYALQGGWPLGHFKFTANWGSPVGGSGYGDYSSNGILPLGVWTHIAVTFDGNDVKLYIDGVVDATYGASGLVFGTVAEELTLGVDFPGGHEYYDGKLDDVRLYDFALTTEQIGDLVSGTVGTNYCNANANSTGAPATISASGSESVAAASLTLTSGPVPNQPGIFFYAPLQIEVPFGHGFLCVSGGIARLPVVVGSGNVATYSLDFSSLPATGQINPGDTWNFQHWYRDPAAGGPAFNTSNGVSIDFTP